MFYSLAYIEKKLIQIQVPVKTVSTTLPRSTRRNRRGKGNDEATSDFDPEEGAEDAPEEEGMSDSDASPNKESQRSEVDSQPGRRSGRLAKKASRRESPEDPELDHDELAEEAADLLASRARPRRRRRSPSIVYDNQPKLRDRGTRKDYRIYRPEMANVDEEDAPALAASGMRPKKTGGAYRSLFSTQGPFGGTGGPTPLFGAQAAAGADSDSSDDDAMRASKSLGGAVGMTPTAAVAQNIFPQSLNSDSLQAGLGKVKDKKALADADPLGVDQNVNFDGVGGMEDHINSLKEMVLLPLLYPELFQTLHITPPRGVLFHGPPGTGKTLLARALASSVSMQGKKVTFYMRKGADALSKWVGEAERQLRLLFEEARKNQPSIIFFDEIDGKHTKHGARPDTDVIQVLRLYGQASKNKFTLLLSPRFWLSWMAWTDEDKLLLSEPPIVLIQSILHCVVLAALTASSTSLYLTRRQGVLSSTFTPKAGSQR